jgi:hypothetical protein
MKLYDVIRKEQQGEEKKDDIVTETFVLTETPRKRRKRIVFIAIALAVICGLYILSFYFVRAKVYVEERTIPFVLDNVVIELGHETESDTERLSFQTMTVTTEISRDLFGSQLKSVSGKAKGSVVFFNEYSKNSVTLKTGTKLVSPTGKTYLTQKSVTIPGYKMDGKKKIAGTSPSVAVIATETGPASNSEGTSLSISGYSGTKKTQLYARSVGAFKGGEEGIRHTISEAERPQILDTLKTQLAERLRRETRAQIPPQLITYPDLQFMSIDTESLKLEGDGIKFPAYIKGTMVSYLIPRDLLESAIAKEALSEQSYKSVSIPALADLIVTAKSGVPADPQVIPDTISIQVNGQGTIITEISPASIQEALLGIKRGLFNDKISAIPEISSAKYRLFPFWAPIFPKKESQIKVDFK